MMARENEKPNARDLSGLLAGGEFKMDGASVRIEALVSGSVN